MPDGLMQIWGKIKGFWQELEKGQKTRLFLTAGVIIAAVIISLLLVLKTTYVPLLESGNDYDLQAIVEYLDSKGINYKKGSNQIYVDSSQKQDIEFDLASEVGVISPNVIFDQSWSKLSLTVTEEDKEKLWKQFEQTNLVYKLKKFENVLDASVQFTKPEKTYWAYRSESEDKGSAFVSLKTKGTLTPGQVDAATRVVAASIGIPEENITIVDEYLNPLNISQRDSHVGMANSQEEMRRNRELELEKKVYNHFKVGVAQNANFDTMSISVSAKLDFDVLNSTEKQYTAPDSEDQGYSKVVETMEEKMQSGQAGQVPGIDANPGTATYQMGSTGVTSSTREQSLEERIFNERQIQSSKALGDLIAEDTKASITLWYGHRVENADTLTNEYIEQIKQDAGYAMGIPTNNISVSIQRLVPDVVAEIETGMKVSSFVEQYGLYLLMAVLLIMMVVILAPRKKKEASPESEAAGEAALAGSPYTVSARIGQDLPDLEFDEKDEYRIQIAKFIKSKPEAVAQLLRNWLSDDWE
ncbi:MAG TPA: flagellar M-ring protein FliF C-terminal domain-containing protein [Thermoclostridium sp.]|nr:flagellar M-ring protein FliF C-terminal domain-containing protein [Thermoclostridium sp.]